MSFMPNATAAVANRAQNTSLLSANAIHRRQIMVACFVRRDLVLHTDSTFDQLDMHAGHWKRKKKIPNVWTSGNPDASAMQQLASSVEEGMLTLSGPPSCLVAKPAAAADIHCFIVALSSFTLYNPGRLLPTNVGFIISIVF
jgi:hypothetical protein